MYILLWPLLLGCVIFQTDGGNPLSPKILFNQKYLINHINIRLLEREWRPNGPSEKTDEVLEEYQWSVNEAFKALITSSYKFQSVPLKNIEQLFQDKNYDKHLDSIVIVHPICATADVFFVKTTVTALTMRNLHKKYNIFAVHMPALNYQMLYSVFFSALGLNTYYEPMAKAVSEFLVVGVDGGHIRPEQINLIGWSYSGQLVGYIGRYFQTRYQRKIATILSLDPWANGLNRELIHVSQDDALVVHTYHTNSLVAGSRERIATADFIYNDGMIQPECEWPHVFKSTIKESMICSHLKVVQRFWYVILYPSKFVGRKCGSWNRFKSCYCNDNPTATMSYPIKLDNHADGIHYLRTLYTKPYGVGKWGAVCPSDRLLYKAFDKAKVTNYDFDYE